MKRYQGYKGFESFLNTTRMNLKMYLHTLIFFLVIQMFVFAFLSLDYLKKHKSLWFFKTYTSAKITSTVNPRHIIRMSLNGKVLSMTSAQYVISYKPFYDSIVGELYHRFMLTSLIYIFYPAALFLFKRKAKYQSEDSFIRGAKLISSDELNRQIKRKKEAAGLQIGKIKLPVKHEVRHAFIVGKPGSGKTVLLNSLLTPLIAKDTKGVIYDYKGDYVSKFYNPDEDILFNPLDKRCLGWSVMNEIKSAMDIDSAAHSLIPQAYQSDPFWNDAARDVFSGILHFLYDRDKRKNSDLWSILTAPGEKIVQMLKSVKGGHRGLRYVEDASSKQAMSVFAVMMQYTKSFEYMSEADGSFSIDEWLDKKRGWIYVTNYPLIQDTLRPVLSLFIDLLGKKLLSQKDDYHRRVFFFLDEFGTLQRLSTIVRLLTLSRSKGASIFIGIQDIGQIDKLYTEPLRQAIVNACGIHVVFSVSDPKTAGFLSEKIGDTAYKKTDETHSMGAARHKDGISISEKDRQEKLVLPSEVMNLEDLTCYVQLPNYSLTKTHLVYKDYPFREEPFLVREYLLMKSGSKCKMECTDEEEKFITDKDTVTKESVQEEDISLDNNSEKEKKGKPSRVNFRLGERDFEV